MPTHALVLGGGALAAEWRLGTMGTATNESIQWKTDVIRCCAANTSGDCQPILDGARGDRPRASEGRSAVEL